MGSCCAKDEDRGKDEKYEFNKDFRGPIKNRGCTDVLCTLLFLIFFLGMLAIAAYAYYHGDPETLLYPSDSSGNLCGSGTYSDRPNVFFFDITKCATMGAAVITSGCPTPQVCVTSCPSDDWTWVLESLSANLAVDSASSFASSLYCDYDTEAAIDDNTNSLTLKELINQDKCASYYLSSEPLVGRCIPSAIADIVGKVLTINGTEIQDSLEQAVNSTLLGDTTWIKYLLNIQSYGSQVMSDVEATWWLILVLLALGAVWAFIWIVLMRCLACPIVWFSLLAFLGLFTFSTYYTWNKYYTLTQNPENTTQITSITDLQFTTDLDYWSNLTYTWMVLGILSALFLFVVLVVLIFLRKHISLAIELIHESSRAISDMLFVLLFPIWPFIFQVVVFGFWGTSAVYLASMGSADYGLANSTTTNSTNASGFTESYDTVISLISSVCDPNANGTEGSVCSFIAYGGDEYTKYLQFYQLFMMFWMLEFVAGVGQMTLAGAFAGWYWTPMDKNDKKQGLPYFPILAACWRVFRYHLGTVAFGALIIAIIRMIRVMLEYIDQKLKGKLDNPIVKCIMCCLKCCFYCLEKFMKFINKNAYILTAVHGYSFCSAAMKAFFLILRNAARFLVVNSVTDFILFIGKLVTVGVIGILSFFFFSGDLADAIPWTSISSWVQGFTPTLNFYLVPVIIVCVGTYVIAAAFFSVYNMSVDTMLICVMEDLERHDGTPEKPFFFRKKMYAIFGKAKKGETGKVEVEGEEKSKGCCGCC